MGQSSLKRLVLPRSKQAALFSPLSQPDLRCSKLPFKVIPSTKASLLCLSSDFLILSLGPLYLDVIFLKVFFPTESLFCLKNP